MDFTNTPTFGAIIAFCLNAVAVFFDGAVLSLPKKYYFVPISYFPKVDTASNMYDRCSTIVRNH